VTLVITDTLIAVLTYLLTYLLTNGVGKVRSPGAPKCRGPPSFRQKMSPAHNLQVMTIHNYLCCMGVLCTWVKL